MLLLCVKLLVMNVKTLPPPPSQFLSPKRKIKRGGEGIAYSIPSRPFQKVQTVQEAEFLIILF